MANTGEMIKSEVKPPAMTVHSLDKDGRAKPLPKDAQVMVAILKDMGIAEYEPKVVNQMLEFSYRYVTNVLEDAKAMSSHARKKAVDVDDVRMAVQMYSDQNLTSPPSRDVLLDFARTKNAAPLPVPRATCGLRLPPDRHCLTACNYRLRNKPKPRGPPGFGGMKTAGSAAPSPKFMNLQPQQQMGQIGMTPSFTVVNQNQAAGNKPIIKISPGGSNAPPSVPMPKIQMVAGGASSNIGASMQQLQQQPLYKISVNPQTLQSNTQPAAAAMKRKADEALY